MSLTRTDVSQDTLKNYGFVPLINIWPYNLITLFDTFVYREEIFNGRFYSKISTKRVSDGLFLALLFIANFIPQNNAVSNNIIFFLQQTSYNLQTVGSGPHQKFSELGFVYHFSTTASKWHIASTYMLPGVTMFTFVRIFLHWQQRNL